MQQQMEENEKTEKEDLTLSEIQKILYSTEVIITLYIYIIWILMHLTRRGSRSLKEHRV